MCQFKQLMLSIDPDDDEDDDVKVVNGPSTPAAATEGSTNPDGSAENAEGQEQDQGTTDTKANSITTTETSKVC